MTPEETAMTALGLLKPYRAECWLTSELASDWRHIASTSFDSPTDDAAIEYVQADKARYFNMAYSLLSREDAEQYWGEMQVEIFGWDEDTQSLTRDVAEVALVPDLLDRS